MKLNKKDQSVGGWWMYTIGGVFEHLNILEATILNNSPRCWRPAWTNAVVCLFQVFHRLLPWWFLFWCKPDIPQRTALPVLEIKLSNQNPSWLWSPFPLMFYFQDKSRGPHEMEEAENEENFVISRFLHSDTTLTRSSAWRGSRLFM